jgi:glycosyltransferase involved in cell wall biosynthesis
LVIWRIAYAAAAGRRCCMDDDLCREMVAKGLRRTRAFTWERAARNFLSVYREVAEGG